MPIHMCPFQCATLHQPLTSQTEKGITLMSNKTYVYVSGIIVLSACPSPPCSLTHLGCTSLATSLSDLLSPNVMFSSCSEDVGQFATKTLAQPQHAHWARDLQPSRAARDMAGEIAIVSKGAEIKRGRMMKQ